MDTSITPRLKGRLGNNLFQVATAMSLAKRHNMDLILDASQNPHSIFAKFKIDNVSAVDYYYEPTFRYTPIKIDPNKSWVIDGYFQCIKYFEDILEEFRSLLIFPEDVKRKCEEVVSKLGKFVIAHYRRGDYVYHPNIHPVQPFEYYTNAIEYFPKDYKIVVCSDDIQYFDSKNRGKFDYMLSTGSQLEDLYLMTLADGHIISNSTYSWWGAVLNQKFRQVPVVAPRKWFGPQGPDATDIYCDGWIVI